MQFGDGVFNAEGTSHGNLFSMSPTKPVAALGEHHRRQRAVLNTAFS